MEKRKRKGLSRTVVCIISSLVICGTAFLAFHVTSGSHITSASAATSWPLEENGSSGENVYSVQYMLRARGYSVTADGDFGPLTETAVKSFQSSKGLSVDGEVGAQTWPALIVSSSDGNSGDQVRALQRQLNLRGAKLSVDGVDGSDTTTAVKSFQSSNGLSVDGVAGPLTWEALVGGGTGGGGGGTTPPPPSGSTLAKIIAYAQAIENGSAEPGWGGGRIPYSWGGGHGSKPGPSLGTCSGYTGSIHPCPASSTVGVDCSGFSRWVYSLAYGSDVLGSGNTDSQLARMHKVSASAAQPGDLVFFGTLSDTHHVGIYIGNNQMINAYATGTYIQTNTVSGQSDLVGYYAY